TRLDWRATSSDAICASPGAIETGLSGTEAWRRKMQRQRPDKILDFSLETLKGRLLVTVPRGLLPHDVRAVLEPFGPILDFNFPPVNQIGYLFVKLQNNLVANQAISCLDNTLINGKRIKVQRALYIPKMRSQLQSQQQIPRLQPMQQLQVKELQLQQQNPDVQLHGCSHTVAVSTSSIETVCREFARRGDFDSDDESYHSTFSVD
ncbi:hypothetical protein PENTCL1PPCAC_11092, partial [Pristionchus entomophagus]